MKRIQTTIDEYVYTSDDDVIEGGVDEGHVYTEADFNKKIVIQEREKKRVEEMFASINPKRKPSFFVPTTHAGMVRDLVNQVSDNKSVDYCVRVTANDGQLATLILISSKITIKPFPQSYYQPEANHRRRCSQRAQYRVDAPATA